MSYAGPPGSESQFYFCRLVPPRPTFAMDMNDSERKAMTEHVGYWSQLMAQDIAIVFGPVADPAGPWGLGIVRVRDAAQLSEVLDGDPAIRANIGLRYESLPMLQAVTRG